MTNPDEKIVDDTNTITPKFETPKSELLRMHLTHLGKIFSNISIFALILSLGSIFSIILYTLIIMIASIGWILLIPITLGLVLLTPNYGSFFNSNLFKVAPTIPANLIFIILGVGIAFSLVSIILLAFDKHSNHKGRIIFSSIVLISTLLILIGIIGGALWEN